jgi:hypothetical protein
LEDLDIGGRMILKEILKEWESMGWTDNAQRRGTWRAVVNTVMNLRVPYSGEFYDQLRNCELFKKDSAHWTA